MNENVIDVLIYLYENYMDSEEEVSEDQILLEEELLKAGFAKEEVDKAFNWLNELAFRQGQQSGEAAARPQAMRVFSDHENRHLDLEVRGLILQLEQSGILDTATRELVIERAMALETQDLTLDDLKWIVLLVLINQPGQENAFALMEEMVYNQEVSYVH